MEYECELLHRIGELRRIWWGIKDNTNEDTKQIINKRFMELAEDLGYRIKHIIVTAADSYSLGTTINASIDSDKIMIYIDAGKGTIDLKDKDVKKEIFNIFDAMDFYCPNIRVFVKDTDDNITVYKIHDGKIDAWYIRKNI